MIRSQVLEKNLRQILELNSRSDSTFLYNSIEVESDIWVKFYIWLKVFLRAWSECVEVISLIWSYNVRIRHVTNVAYCRMSRNLPYITSEVAQSMIYCTGYGFTTWSPRNWHSAVTTRRIHLLIGNRSCKNTVQIPTTESPMWRFLK